MRIELWAVDTVGGRAIIRQGDRWLLVSRERGWQPVDTGGRGRAYAWLLSPTMVLVGQPCSNFTEAILEARRASAAGTPGVLRRLLGRVAKPISGSVPVSWEEQFPAVIECYSDRLDRFFRLRGCSERLSFDLSLKAFLRLFDQGPQKTEEHLSRLLRDIASDLCPFGRRIQEADPPSRSARPLNEMEVARLTRLLPKLDPRVRRFLCLWTASKGNHEDMAKLMRLSGNEVRARLVQAAAAAVCTIDDLGSPEMAEACVRARKGRRR